MADRRLAPKRTRGGDFPSQSRARRKGSVSQSALTVGGQLRELRKNAGLSQRALAQQVGTTASVICRLEDDRYEGHTLDMLRRIGAVLGKRVEVRFLAAVPENQASLPSVLPLPNAKAADPDDN